MSGPNTSISNLTVEMTGDSAQGFDAVAFHLHGAPALSNLDIYAVNGNDDEKWTFHTFEIVLFYIKFP